MIRTQVFLPESLYQKIDLVAKRERKPKAKVIRELLTQSLAQKSKGNAGEDLLAFAKLGEEFGFRGPPDLSSKIDELLYSK